VRRISETGATADEVARQASEIAHIGREFAEQAAIGMTGVREMTLRSARTIKRLGETTQQIGEVVRLVADFAEQTNVLALNAAIEAVRAGEHGSGFKIIAQQIRGLAESSSEATARITQRIKSVQMETSAVVVAIEECTRQVVIQSDLAAQAGAALGAVDTVSQRIAARVEEIRATAEEQALVSQRVARAMEEIAGVTAGTRDGMEWMRGAMERLAELARALQREIAVFRLQSGAPATPEADAAFSGARSVRATLPPAALPSEE
jgi:methyl-accepting chemotaxis protein